MTALQQRVWNYSDLDVAPSHLFVVAAESGGQVLGAFLGESLVGFTLAYAGEKHGKPYLHSHFAAVLPEYRDLGIGRQLKIAQRQQALDRGIDRIEWTFDPLQSKNAYFNICRLGAVCRNYLPNLYGTTSSPLHGGLPTDRLLAEWHLDSPRVREVLSGRIPALQGSPETLQIALDPARLNPSDVKTLQTNLRERFSDLFSRSYAVTWFERCPERALYLLEAFSPPDYGSAAG
jgi:predicted GNAT superfamily acetyltransferase